jgi:hypothetical protein
MHLILLTLTLAIDLATLFGIVAGSHGFLLFE